MNFKNERIMKKFVLDEEIDLLAKKEGEDKEQSVDLLNSMTYVDTLTECVLNAPENKSVTIGLFGAWGTGKSSIIRTFQGIITKKYDEKDKKVKVITYDAWKYANDSFRRMFLLQMQQDLGFVKTELMNKFYLNSSEDAHIDTKINWRELWFGILLAFMVVFSIVKFANISEDHKIIATAIVSFASLVLAIWRGMFKEVKVNIQRPHLFAPEQFEDCFNEMCERAYTKSPIEQSYLKYIKGDKGDSGIDRIIIVIDNVDRCSPQLAYELLTNIKNFLGNNHNTIFIIPVDENALKKHVVGNKEITEHEDEEFLRKFFNVCIRIKPFKREEMFDFADSLNKKYGLGFEPTTVSLVANEFAKNPRRIIQMFNNLTVELDTMPKEFAEKNQVLICLLLIIREEYPDFYKKLQNDSWKLYRLDELKDDKTGVLDFLKLNQAVLDTYAKNVFDVEHVLSNSKVFDSIPETVKNDYTKMIYSDETKKALTNNQIRNGLISYVEKALQKAIMRKLWETDVKNTVDRIMALNKEIPLSDGECLRLVGMLKEESVFKEIASKQKTLHSLIEFAAKTDEIGVSSVASSLVNYMDSNANTDYKDQFDVWYACSVLNNSRIKRLNRVILAACKKDIKGLMAFDYGAKSGEVYADSILEFVISKIKDDEDNAVKCMLHIASKIKIDKKYLVSFVNAVNEVTPAYDFNSNNTDALKKRLNEVNQMMGKASHCILDGKDKECLANFYEKFKKVTTQSVQQNYNRIQVNRSFMIDNIENEAVINNILLFFYETSHLTKVSIVDTETISSLIAKGKYNKGIVETLCNLLNEGYPVEIYSNNILEIKDYSQKQLLLLDHILKVNKADGGYYVGDDKVKSVLTKLLDLSLAKDNELKNEHANAISTLVIDDRNADVLTKIFLEKDKKWLLALPKDLFGYAIKVFEDNLNDYKEQQNVLTLLAEKGSKKAKKTLVGIVNAKINNEKERDKGFEILLSFEGLTASEIRPLESSLEYIKENTPQLKEKVEQCQKHLDGMAKPKAAIKKEDNEEVDKNDA